MSPILKNSECLFDSGFGQILTINCIPVLFEAAIRVSLIFAGFIALVFIILGGIKLITSSGDSKQVEGARKTITWAVIGLVLVLMSFAIVRFVGAITGVNCINQFGFNVCGNRTNPNSRPSADFCETNPTNPRCR